MTDHVVSGLVRKRAEIAGRIVQLQKDLRHIDGALVVLGYDNPKEIEALNPARREPLFRQGELMRLVGEAMREGCVQTNQVVFFVMHRRGLDKEDKPTVLRVRTSVKDCMRRFKKRMSRGAAGA
jgi:hypothetical protein